MLEEQGSALARDALGRATIAVTSRLSRVEVHSALLRAVRAGRLSGSELAAAQGEFARLWPDLYSVEVDESIVTLATQMIDRHAICAYDAIQLASAVSSLGTDATFACWDVNLNRAARAERLAVLGAEPATG